jgi:ABC-2 type transport system permease protein
MIAPVASNNRMAAIVVGPLPVGAGLLVVFGVSLVGAYGLGFLFAGLALVFKRTTSLTNLVFSLMIFFTGAFVGLESLGWVFTATRFAFPLTWGISLMRAMLSGDVNLHSLWRGGELVGMCLHSAAYLAVGLVAFAWGYRTARRNGTLAHY